MGNFGKVDLEISDGAGDIQLLMVEADIFPDEGYRIQIDAAGIVLQASSESGIFYAIQTFAN